MEEDAATLKVAAYRAVNDGGIGMATVDATSITGIGITDVGRNDASGYDRGGIGSAVSEEVDSGAVVG